MLGVKDSFRKNIRSYGFAFKGIRALFAENNFKIQLLVAAVVIAVGFSLAISLIHWLILLGCIGMVLMAEAMNTAIEKLCNHLHPEQHPAIGKVKDMAAAGVLIVAMAAALIGVMVFWGYLM
jgi:diacylglycerol kinase (ATP)